MSEIKHIQLNIQGLHCASCVAGIERTLKPVAGIQAVAVNLATETISLEYNSAVITLSEIDKIVSGIGFKLLLNSSEQKVKAILEDSDIIAIGRQSEALAIERLTKLKNSLYPVFLAALPLLFLSMAEMLGFSLPEKISSMANPLRFALLQLLLSLPALYAGRSIYFLGFRNLYLKMPDMNSLVALGTGAAVLYSIWNTIQIALGDAAELRVMDLYYESAAMLLALILLGRYLELRSKLQASNSIRALMNLAPDKALLLENYADKHKLNFEPKIKEINQKDIKINDILLVRPGDRVPTDGVLVQGDSEFDESMLSGESLPVHKQAENNDKVVGGTVNLTSLIYVQATVVGVQTTLAKIIRLVREAQGSKAKIAALADKISFYFVPAVIAMAVLAALTWFLVGQDFSFCLKISISVLVVACPCAMGLATPISIMVATGRAAELGFLIKNAESLEVAAKISAMVFDKTGTLTENRLHLVSLDLLPQAAFCLKKIAGKNITQEEELKKIVLQIAAALETGSTHPVALAVSSQAKKLNLNALNLTDFSVLSGQGVAGNIEFAFQKLKVRLGKLNFALQEDVALQERATVNEIKMLLKAKAEQGQSALLMVIDAVPVAVLSFTAPLRPEAKESLAKIAKMGIKIFMLTGDNQIVAEIIGRQLGIKQENIFFELSPQQKKEKIAELLAQKEIVAMVGDGINDAPSLVGASLGIAMSGGTDVAVEVGDIVLIKEDLSAIIQAVTLSVATLQNIKQNLFWAFAYNIVCLPVAAGFFYAWNGLLFSPMLAGGLMVLSSVSVVSNALRLRKFN